ncbi:hypothetical protein RD792_007736 [Penstemon davidsonii]|uniref:Uncharacterized protein n=1 Tax=Penstemon davidsonii TaxID=160366 RepID=A0ABR0D778_9LAMI|nr:hypothetical protein RD792_007736 [Penstemon davidsonii]
MLRYSNVNIFGPGTLWTDIKYPVRLNKDKALSGDQFMRDLKTLLDGLRLQAASGGSLHKVAAGRRTGPDFQTIYAMVQCTPDLSLDECDICLNSAALDLPRCCNASAGVIVLMPSCYLVYDLYYFYNQSRLEELLRVGPAPIPPPLVPLPSQPVPVPSPQGTGDNNTTRIINVVVSIVAGLLLVAFVGFLVRKRIKQNPEEELEIGEDVDDISVIESLHNDFDKIRVATNDFSQANKLGQGGFGPVNKGKLQNGQEIAVKRLSRNSCQGDLEFKNEVVLLAKLQHGNLVRLLGFSVGGNEKLLVYEFVENASLDHFIFDPTKRSYLDWDRRCKIIKGIIKGLLYLHEDSRLRIIHRDLKASNVLLDGDMNPKIADFGMARLFVTDETQGNTSRIVGTHGYMASEYAMHGQFSVKTDVFSFGVIVLEVISVKKALLSSKWAKRGRPPK